MTNTTKTTKTTATKASEATVSPVADSPVSEDDEAAAFIAATLAPFAGIANPTERVQAMWMAGYPLVQVKTGPGAALAKATLSVLLLGIKAAHTSARTAGKPAFDEATKAFRAEFEKACEPARKAFDEATKGFREQYETACKPFAHLLGDTEQIEASYKTLRMACVSMRDDMADTPPLFNQGRKAGNGKADA